MRSNTCTAAAISARSWLISERRSNRAFRPDADGDVAFLLQAHEGEVPRLVLRAEAPQVHVSLRPEAAAARPLPSERP